jgi:hypothetical protein
VTPSSYDNLLYTYSINYVSRASCDKGIFITEYVSSVQNVSTTTERFADRHPSKLSAAGHIMLHDTSESVVGYGKKKYDQRPATFQSLSQRANHKSVS